MLQGLALAALAPLFVSAAIGPEGTLKIVNEVIAPDGFQRSAVLAKTGNESGVMPGVVISGNKGDTFKINVVNELTEASMYRSTSVHWHGIVQHTSAWADGAAFVTQCPIAPGHSFLYQFTVNQAGTSWYHSHLGTQYCEGLRGAFVVYDPQDPYLQDYDIDDENTIISLSDWYHSAGAAGRPLATLINGKGRYDSGPAVALSVVNVVQGKRYRFRIINMACDPNYKFSIQNHWLTVIEVDGILHDRRRVDSLQIFAGQRYSVVMQADQPVGNYWIRAQPNLGTTTFDGGLNSAILRYAGAPDAEPAPASLPTPTAPLREADLVPLTNIGAPGVHQPGAADININLAFGRSGSQFTVNGHPFTAPTVPVLLQIMSGAYTAQDLLPSDTIYTLPPNKVIEISMPAAGAPGAPHPMHLHGHSFDVVRTAGSSVYNYVNPVRRDVVSMGDGSDNVTIRFKTDNSGPWMLHCHIDRHLVQGFAVVLAEDTQGIAAANPIPPAWDELCPIYEALDPEDQ